MKEKHFGIIYNYGYNGEGVCRLDGKVVFLPYALKGEEVEFIITDDTSSFSRGRVVNILKSSPLRENPPCPYFGRCGGCQYQHTSYENELAIKKSILEGHLKKIGYAGRVEVFPSEKEYEYRNKIRLFVSSAGLSLKEEKSNTLCKVDRCLLISQEMNRAIGIIDTFLKAQNLYNEYCQVLIREENDSLLVMFYKEGKKEINYQGLELMLGSKYGIFEYVDGFPVYKIGKEALICDEFGLKCKFSPTTFHQVNRFVGNELYKNVLQFTKGKTIINCYSGAGVLSGIIAKEGKRVIGIELGKSEHEDAEKLKEENNLFYLTNYNGDCGKVLPKIKLDVDTIIVDPPRSGLDKSVVNEINNAHCQRLIYISCNSATCVRDIARLPSYKLKEVKLFDMFARTGEFEILTILDRI